MPYLETGLGAAQQVASHLGLNIDFWWEVQDLNQELVHNRVPHPSPSLLHLNSHPGIVMLVVRFMLTLP